MLHVTVIKVIPEGATLFIKYPPTEKLIPSLHMPVSSMAEHKLMNPLIALSYERGFCLCDSRTESQPLSCLGPQPFSRCSMQLFTAGLFPVASRYRWLLLIKGLFIYWWWFICIFERGIFSNVIIVINEELSKWVQRPLWCNKWKYPKLREKNYIYL